MADTKITSLQPPQVTTNPATDVLPIVNIADPLMATSGSTRKITVNQLLGAGGTATLASATITGDLTVDTSTLKVDSANNRVGIGTATPAEALHVSNGNIRMSINQFLYLYYGSATNYASLGADNSGNVQVFTGLSSPANRFQIANDGVCTWSNIGGVAGTAMTLNSTGLGVGVASPAQKVDVDGNIQMTGVSGGTRYLLINGDNTYTGSLTIQSGRGSGNFGAATVLYGNSHATYPGGVWIGRSNGSTGPIMFGTGGITPTTVQMTLDTSGNVGIGVTPSAWNTSFKAIELLGGNINTSSTANIRVVQNAVYTSSQFVYKTAGLAATSYSQSAGAHTFFNAPVGANANDPIIFSPAMTLDASGNLLLGVTSAGGNRLNVQTASGDCLMLVKSQAANTNLAIDYVSNYGNYTIRKSGTAVWDYGVISDSSATPAFKIQNASSVGVQLVSGATAWTTLSDETMKDIIEPISNAVAKVGSLRSVIGKFKTDDASKRRSFLIAQDVQSVLPEAVDVIGENNELGLRYTEVIPLLVAAIKELTAEVNALKKA